MITKELFIGQDKEKAPLMKSVVGRSLLLELGALARSRVYIITQMEQIVAEQLVAVNRFLWSESLAIH